MGEWERRVGLWDEMVGETLATLVQGKVNGIEVTSAGSAPVVGVVCLGCGTGEVGDAHAGLGRLQSACAILRWWMSVVEAREARETGKRVVERVQAMGLAKVVTMAERWQSSWVFQDLKQAVVDGVL